MKIKDKIIKITVGGYSTAGKSTISELIAIVLKKEGFNVVIENIDDMFNSDNENGDGQNQARVREIINDAIPYILEKTDKIVIQEIQYNHHGIENK